MFVSGGYWSICIERGFEIYRCVCFVNNCYSVFLIIEFDGRPGSVMDLNRLPFFKFLLLFLEPVRWPNT